MSEGVDSNGHAGRGVRRSTSIEPDEQDREFSTALVMSIASAMGTDPENLPPLTESVDPDALDAVFDGGGDPDRLLNNQLMFEYAGHQVCVFPDGHVTLRPLEES